MSASNTVVSRNEIRLDAWRGVFEKTNRILSGQKVTVEIVKAGDLPSNMTEVPGWSDGTAINLNGVLIDKMLSTKDALASVLRLKGLNYHELCHVLYTPRLGEELPRRILERAQQDQDTSWWYTFNALEDQRIETWFTASYRASKRYFEATVLEWILTNGSAESAILIYGRKYLSPKIRVQAGRVFKKKYGDALYADFQNVIDEYVTLVLPTDTVKAQQLIVRFHELLKKMQAASGAPLPTLVIMDNGMGGSTSGTPTRGSCDAARTGRTSVKEQRRARDRALDGIEDSIDADLSEEDRLEEEAAAKAAAEGDGEGKDAATGDGGNGKAKSKGGSGGTPTGSASDGGASAESNGTGVSSSGTADHRGSGDADGGLTDAIHDMIEEAESQMDEVREDEQVLSDAKSIMDAVKATEQNAQMEAEGKAVRNGKHFSPSESTVGAVRRIVSILTRIRQEAEPETLRRQHSGRVDVRRVISRQPHEVDIFNTWDSGSEEETGVEAVLLVDVSGSMSNRLTEAAEAMWVFKRSFDKLDIRTTVLLFDTRHLVLYQPSDKARPGAIPQIASGGGTDPTSALEQALRILSKSQHPNRVVITVTDGGWGGSDDEQAKIMKALHKAGAVTMLLGLDQSVEYYGAHHHMEAHDLKSVRDLSKAALKLVGGIMRESAMH